MTALLVVFVAANATRGLQVYHWQAYAKEYGPSWARQLAPFFAKAMLAAFDPRDIARAVRAAR